MPRKKPKKAARPESVYDRLRLLIQAYADAQEADSWKGGGDPADVEVIEVRLKLARVELLAHIERMERDAQ